MPPINRGGMRIFICVPGAERYGRAAYLVSLAVGPINIYEHRLHASDIQIFPGHPGAHLSVHHHTSEHE